MSEETNNVVETTEQDTPPVEEQQEESTSEPKPAEPQDIDYHQKELEKELEAERARREKAEAAARTKDIELKRIKKQDESIFEEEDAPSGLTEDRLREILQEERQAILAQSQESQAKQLAQSKAQSPAEAERIMLAYNNRIRHTGDVQSDVESAWTLVNAHKLSAMAEEQRRAFASATGRGTGASAGSPQGHEGSIPSLPATIPGRNNFKLDKKSGAYVGTSGQTRLLYRNGDFVGQRLENGSWVDND